MKGSSYLTWFRRLLILGAVAAAATASAAGAAGNATAPDVLERYAAAHPYGTASVPDVLERYAAAHPSGRGVLQPVPATDRIVDDWFRDPPGLASPTADRIVDDSFRDPVKVATPQGNPGIVDDSFRDAPTIATPQSTGNGLDWGDVGIGAGAMFVLTMLVAGLGLGTLTARHRSGRLGTS
jgi:hypothetical protein